MKRIAKQTFKKNVKQLLALTLILLLILNFSSCGFLKKKENKDEIVNWGQLELNHLIPKIESAYGNISSNSEQHLSITLNNIEKEQYKDYVQTCIEKGFIIESENDNNTYQAFNADGYKLRLSYYQDKLNITVDAPEKMSEFEWPTTGLATVIPQTESTFGRISWNNSTTFIIRVGETTLDDYKEYVKLCENAGFVLDYSKDEKYYSAKNADGYKLSLWYLGFNKIEISLKAPENVETTVSMQETQKNPEETSVGTYVWRDFLKDYEAFVDRYIEIYNKYKENPSDMSILSDYMEVLAEMTEWAEKADKIKLEIKDTEEVLEFSKELLRIAQKLSSAMIG